MISYVLDITENGVRPSSPIFSIFKKGGGKARHTQFHNPRRTQKTEQNRRRGKGVQTGWLGRDVGIHDGRIIVLFPFWEWGNERGAIPVSCYRSRQQSRHPRRKSNVRRPMSYLPFQPILYPDPSMQKGDTYLSSFSSVLSPVTWFLVSKRIRGMVVSGLLAARRSVEVKIDNQRAQFFYRMLLDTVERWIGWGWDGYCTCIEDTWGGGWSTDDS